MAALLTLCVLGTLLSITAPIAASAATVTTLAQQGYIWENDDQAAGATVDGASPQAAGSTPLAGVRLGERLTLRTQLTNSGPALGGSTQLGLFYDRGDNIWTKVKNGGAAVTAAGTCANTTYSCSVVDASANEGNQTSMAFDNQGRAWIAYQDKTNFALRVARYVGTGGNCGTSNTWQCTTIAAPSAGGDQVGNFASIGIAPNGDVWVAYYDITATALFVAKYVGSGGTGCVVSSWSCGLVDWAADMGASPTALAFDGSGNPWVSYYNASTNDVHVANYVGSGGTGCDTTGGTTPWSGKWKCTAVDTAGMVGRYDGIAADATGAMWMSYWDETNSRLRVARYVGGASGTGCASTAWTCESIDIGGSFTAIAFDPNGKAWVSYYDTAAGRLRIARHVGAGGTGCSDTTAWSCSTADNNTDTGQYTSLAFDAAGAAWVSEWDLTNADLKLARYVGSGGTGCGTGVTAWTCTTLDTSATSVGAYTSLAFNNDGAPWISYVDSTNNTVKIARLNRANEIVMSPGAGGSTNGAGINASHADMTSTSDSANKTDADCIASATWNNGKWSDGENIAGVNLPNGATTPQCTEVAFVVTTAQAFGATQYRFVVASNDGWYAAKGMWRGPGSIVAHPTLTTAAGPTVRAGKDVYTTGSQTCTDTSWVCVTVESTGDIGVASSIAFDGHGMAWMAYVDSDNDSLKWARRVATGGTGCTAGMTTWTCATLDAAAGHDFSGAFASPVSLQLDQSGSPWVAYYDGGASYLDLRVARYVGTGGSGCAAGVTAWSCTTIDSTGDVGMYPQMAMDATGKPWISYYDATNGALRVARFTGSGGTGCAAGITTWTCVSVATANDSGAFSSITLDPYGNPWVAFRVVNTTRLMVARYVGTGGTGCSLDAWTCYSVDTSGNTGQYTSIAFDGTGTAYSAYYDVTNKTLRMARFVGSGGGSAAGCGSGSSAAWSCMVLDNTVADTGRYTAMAADAQGNLWLMYKDQTNSRRMEARYVGTGGSGCAAGVTTWSCAQLVSDSTYGGWADIAFDANGAPWASFYLISVSDLIVVKMIMPPTPPTSVQPAMTLAPGGHNARRSDGRYALDAGESPRGSCAGAAGLRGYCGIITDDTDYDSQAAGTYSRPAFTFAIPSNSNAAFPSYRWTGQSDFSNTVTIQVFRYGSTNAWTTLATNGSPTINTDFTLTGTASVGSASEYWQSDGSRYWTYYRVYQNGSTGTPSSLTLKSDFFGTQLAPLSPTPTAQLRSNDVVIATGGWTNEASATFTADVSDQDFSDTVYLCVEIKPVASAFTNADTGCGSATIFSGAAVSARVTIGSLVSGTSYHWQARAKDAANQYSGWSSYGGNSDVVTAATDVRIDLAAPSTGTVYDGNVGGVQKWLNDGTLTTLSGNWTGFADPLSGIVGYDYAIGTSPGGNSILDWTTTASTSFTASALSLQTTTPYYVSVRAKDVAGNVSNVVTSSGQVVAPSLTFTVSSPSLQFTPLAPGNSFTDSKSLTLTVTTNARYGYAISQQVTQLLTAAGGTLPMYAGTWASPTAWTGNGFGYTSDDPSVSGSNRFAGGTAYAAPTLSAPGDTVADGSGPVIGATHVLTYKVVGTGTSPAGRYQTTIRLGCVALY